MGLSAILRTTAYGRRSAVGGLFLLPMSVAVALTSSIVWGQESASTAVPQVDVVVGITMPCQEATLAPVLPGRIGRILASEGKAVREGDLIFSLEDAVQRARTEIAMAASESTLEIELGAATWERAKRDVDRLVGLYGDDSASSKELSDAVAEADIARLEYELARFAHLQAVRAYQREQAALEQFHSRAPFTGYVAQHLKHAGDTVDENEGVVTLVQLDPLQVSLDCPLGLASSVKHGDRLWVHPVDARWEPRMGSVALASRVADPASQTFKVKLTVDNADAGWMAGLKVLVRFSASAAYQEPVAVVAEPPVERADGGAGDARGTPWR